MKRDYIMSFISRPGRVISPAAVDEVAKGRIGEGIQPATQHETDEYIRKRLAEARPVSERLLGGPVSQTRVNEVLRLAISEAGLFAGVESRIVEFKSRIPSDRRAASKIAITMAAYANTGGGYVIFGVEDHGNVKGISSRADFARSSEMLSDVVSNYFCPKIEWDQDILEFSGKKIGVIYAYQSEKRPVVAMADYDEIKKSTIYFRYEGKSQRIEPGDLINLIAEVRREAGVAESYPSPE